MSLASSLPITLTDGAVMGRYRHMHISSNLILCLKSEREVLQVVETMTSHCMFNVVTQPNQANREQMFLKMLSHSSRLGF